MKKLVFLFAGLLFMAISAESVKAQTATANAAATIVTPITIEKSGDLNFGAIAQPSAAGTVVVTSEGVRSGSVGVTLLSQLGAPSAASFHVTGATNAQFTVTLPTTDVTLTKDGGTETMTVSTFTHNATGTLSGGAQDFGVGATLTVAATQASGEYTGSFNVTVTYQ